MKKLHVLVLLSMATFSITAIKYTAASEYSEGEADIMDSSSDMPGAGYEELLTLAKQGKINPEAKSALLKVALEKRKVFGDELAILLEGWKRRAEKFANLSTFEKLKEGLAHAAGWISNRTSVAAVRASYHSANEAVKALGGQDMPLETPLPEHAKQAAK